MDESGCALCGSTWGNVWREVEGERRFFCCDLCGDQYDLTVRTVKERTGWSRVTSLEFTGGRGGRVGVATHEGRTYRFEVAFNSTGEIWRFRPTG